MNLKTLFPFLLFIILAICVCLTVLDTPNVEAEGFSVSHNNTIENYWIAPDSTQIPTTEEGNIIRYGKKLIQHTSFYFGPKGIIAQITNGMNCQNCHLQSGTKVWGNNYGAVAANYPKQRPRSGKLESVFTRINDCFQRSLNGQKIDTNSIEMKAISSYILWLGKKEPKGRIPNGSGLMKLELLTRSANLENGASLYNLHCKNCHQSNGEGILNSDSTEYVYPPLWGKHSYNIGAGMHCISKLAGFIKPNMPFGVAHLSMVLTDEQAWDIAAFVNSQKRPSMDLKNDWPDIAKKPMDYPFGPYTDQLTEHQHKYGPYVNVAISKK